jgi:CheY-like chemotaxis protein
MRSRKPKTAKKRLAAVAKARPDLILMGIQLPIMDGYEVTRQIRANPATGSIPIIAITSHALDGEEHVMVKRVPDDFARALSEGLSVLIGAKRLV